MQPMSPDAIEAIFSSLAGQYGRRFIDMWDGIDHASVKAVWAQQLAPFSTRPKAIRWALANLPEHPPSCPAFKNLCDEASHRGAMEAWEIDDKAPRLPAKSTDLLR